MTEVNNHTHWLPNLVFKRDFDVDDLVPGSLFATYLFIVFGRFTWRMMSSVWYSSSTKSSPDLCGTDTGPGERSSCQIFGTRLFSVFLEVLKQRTHGAHL